MATPSMQPSNRAPIAPPLAQPQPAQTAPTAAPAKPFNPQAQWQAEQDYQQAKLKNLEAQVGTYQQGVGNLAAAQQKAQQALRARSDQALAGSRGMLGGGRGLAMLQQAALTRGAQEGEMSVAQQQAMQQAKLAAQGAEAELLGEKAKMLKAAADSQARANQAVASAKKFLEERAGDQWFTFDDEDRKAVVDRIQKELLASEADPTVRKALVDYMNSVLQGKENASGLYDT